MYLERYITLWYNKEKTQGDQFMPFVFRGDIMARLKDLGWSEYQIRKHKVLSAATIKSIKQGLPNISIHSLDEICHMLGDVSADAVIEYIPRRDPTVNDNTPKIKANARLNAVSKYTEEWYAQGHTGFGPEYQAYIAKRQQEDGSH